MRSVGRAAGWSVVAALVFATLVHGGPLAPLRTLARHGDVIAAHLPVEAMLAAVLGAWLAAVLLARRTRWPTLVPVLVLTFAMAAASGLAFARMGAARAAAVERFGAECVALAPLWRSFREAPREFQFFTHGTAVKDGAPYGWSWGEMRFYPLPPNVARNVLPAEVAACLPAGHPARD